MQPVILNVLGIAFDMSCTLNLMLVKRSRLLKIGNKLFIACEHVHMKNDQKCTDLSWLEMKSHLF